MIKRAAIAILSLLGIGGCTVSGGAPASAGTPEHGGRGARPAMRAGKLAAVSHGALCVTRGDVSAADGALRVATPTTRAVAPGSAGDSAALRFTYHGPTDEVTRLASGQIRHQLGLKLRAADGCNLVYVMWRMEPKPFIEVQVKLNPGKHTHAECGANGYIKVKPARSKPVPAFDEGVSHMLEAAIDGDTLVAKVDGDVVWEGELDPGARGLSGPAGMRSDNVRYDAELLVAPAGGDAAAMKGHGCHGGSDDE
jgi:hypothetical protein